MSELAIEAIQSGRAYVVRLRGSAGLAAGPALEREVTRLIAGHHEFIVLDLTSLTSIASLAIGQLLQLQRAVRSRGGRVVLANPNPDVQGVLARTRVTELLPIFPSLEAAIAGWVLPDGSPKTKDSRGR